MRRRSDHGSALLAVLWLAAALSAIAFTLSMTVRAELDRAALQVDSVQAYYRAAGAIDSGSSGMRLRLVTISAPIARYATGARRCDALWYGL